MTWNDLYHPDEPVHLFTNNLTGQTYPHAHTKIELARDTGVGTEIAEVTITAHGPDCAFAGQAVVQPG